MENHVATPAKMLICFVGRRRGERLVRAAKAAGARGGTILMGKSLTGNRVLRALSLADVQQDIVYFLLRGEAGAVVDAIRRAAVEDRRRFAGVAVLLDVPELYLRKMHLQPDSGPVAAARSRKMESGYKLINVIVNSGYGDDVMAAARKAGARGGTILGARGTGTEEDVKFFGITLVPEKEMLMIVAEEGKVKGIVEEITRVSTLNEPGGGIVYNQNVEEFIVLGGKG